MSPKASGLFHLLASRKGSASYKEPCTRDVAIDGDEE